MDEVIDVLGGDDRTELLSLCRYNPQYSDIQVWLSERGHTVSLSAVQSWYKRNFPIGAEAIAVSKQLEVYAGVDPILALEASIGLAAQMLGAVKDAIERREALETMKPETLLHMLTVLLKEQRVAAIALETLKTAKDKKALELAGGYRIAEICTHMAESHPQHQAISDFLAASLAQLEKEVG